MKVDANYYYYAHDHLYSPAALVLEESILRLTGFNDCGLESW